MTEPKYFQMRPEWTYLIVQYNFISIGMKNDWNKKNI